MSLTSKELKQFREFCKDGGELFQEITDKIKEEGPNEFVVKSENIVKTFYSARNPKELVAGIAVRASLEFAIQLSVTLLKVWMDAKEAGESLSDHMTIQEWSLYRILNTKVF